MFLIHFIFTMVKMVVLASIYATLTLLVIRLTSKYRPEWWLSKVSTKKLRFWFGIGAFYSFSLFVFSMSYWGNHGLGDSARIPIGFGKSVNNYDAYNTYIDRVYEFGTLEIETYALGNGHMVGKTDVSTVDRPPDYFDWNLKTDSLQYFEDIASFERYAQREGLPLHTEFKHFNDHYKEYWNGWKVWFIL